jgi:hypothetical protein
MSAEGTIALPAARGSPRQSVSRAELTRFFAEIGSCMELSEIEPNWPGQKELEQFLAGISVHIARAEKQQRELDRKEATRFNVFDLIEPDENKLSDVLKLLLDPKGSHGQGDLFLRLLLDKLGFGSRVQRTADARVQREAPTHALRNQRRRLDVLVEAGVLLAIENKVDSAEQENQVKDYLEHLARSAARRQQPHVLIYLTPEGHKPDSLKAAELKVEQDSGQLRCWSYQRDLCAWLEDCRQHCKAQKIQCFLSDFITHIATDLKREVPTDQQEQVYEN